MEKTSPSGSGPLSEHLSAEHTRSSPLIGSSSTDETFGRVTSLGGGRLQHLRAHHEVLKPGTRSSRPHYHTNREECVLVLAGVITVVAGDRTFTASKSDFISFPAGPPKHVLRNDSATDVELLVVSAAPSEDQVVYGDEPAT